MNILPRLRAMHALYEALGIEDAWALWSDTGFLWWPGALRQRVRCSDARHDADGSDRFQLFVETDVLTGVPESGELAERLAAVNRVATASGLVWRRETGNVALVASATLGGASDADGTGRTMPVVALLQLNQALDEAASLARYLGGRVAWSAHPDHGPRRMKHVLATEVAGQIVPKGLLPSAWAEDPAFALLAACLERDGAIVRERPGELGAALPYSGSRCCTLRLTSHEPHPTLGNGLHARLTLPEARPRDEAAELAVALNATESLSSETHYQGGWTHVETSSGWQPAFVRFVPNAAYDEEAASRLVADCVRRAAWLAEEFFDDEPAAPSRMTLQ